MYKNNGLLDISSREIENKDYLDIEVNYYNNLYKINKLFKEKKYESIIGSKKCPDSIKQRLIYINPINKTERFILDIENKYSINVAIPIKNSNYLYSSLFLDIEKVYNFLKIHI